MAQRLSSPFEEPPIFSRELKQINPYVVILRNKLEEKENNLPLLFGDSLGKMRGHWSSYLGNRVSPNSPPKEIIFEIGTHLGKSLCEYAASHPDLGFVGCDITYKRVVTTAQRLSKRAISNAVSCLFNANHMSDLFSPNELDGVIVFFPDPWSKARRAKHRLLNPNFCQQLETCIKPGGFFWFKTDQEKYFLDTLAFMENRSLKLIEPSECTGFLAQKFNSTFEQKFSQRGQKTFEAKWRKKIIS